MIAQLFAVVRSGMQAWARKPIGWILTCRRSTLASVIAGFAVARSEPLSPRERGSLT